MAHIRPRITILLFVTLFFVHAHGFALKKRNVENKLNEALKVIERQKRQVRYDVDDRDWSESGPDMYDWEQGYPPMDISQYKDIFDFPALRDYYTRRYDGENDIRDPEPIDWNSIFQANQEEVDGEPENGSKPVSEEELREIFEPSEDSVDKRESSEDALLAEALAGKSAKAYPAPEKTSKRAEDEESQGLSQTEMEELLKGANLDFENALAADSMDNEVDGDRSVVSKEEIQNIFKNIDRPDEGNDEDIIDNEGEEADNSDPMMFLNEEAMENNIPEDENNLTDDELNKETFGNEDEAVQNKASIKRKRSNWNTYPSSYQDELGDEASEEIEDLAAELAAAKADVKILKTFLALEEEENANLAKALNLATKSQTERSDKYVEEEVQYIKDAIRDEIDLEEIRDVLQVASEIKGPNLEARMEGMADDEDIDLSALEDEPTLDKRGYQEEDELDMPLAPMEDSLEQADEEEEPEEAISAEDLADIILASKLKELLSQNKQEFLNDIEEKPPGLGAWYEAPVVSNAKADSKDYYLNPLMRELYEKLQVQNMAKRAGGGFDDPNSCPAVDLLTDGCTFMHKLGLGLDGEATDLCNRHQVCYTCGAALDLSPDDCDRGYLSESAMLCQQEGGCDEDAAGLFIIMLKYHDFLPLSRVPDQCASPCAAEYIGGDILTRKK